MNTTKQNTPALIAYQTEKGPNGKTHWRLHRRGLEE